MFKKIEVEAILKSLFIFSATEKNSILAEYENATQESIDSLLEILKGAYEKQKEYFTKMISADSQFVHKTKKYIRKTVDDMQSGQQQTDAHRMKSIEAEFDL